MRMQLVDFGDRIRKYRKQKGWTQEKLAEEIGISVTYLRYIEQGKRIPGLWTFLEILCCLDISWDEIVVVEAARDMSGWEKWRSRIAELSDDKQRMIWKVVEVMVEEMSKVGNK